MNDLAEFLVEMRNLDARESARRELQERLDAARTQGDRNRLGQFGTPPELASEIISYADSLLPQRSKIHFLEPGFGTGPFYSALLSHVTPSRIEASAPMLWRYLLRGVERKVNEGYHNYKARLPEDTTSLTHLRLDDKILIELG